MRESATVPLDQNWRGSHDNPVCCGSKRWALSASSTKSGSSILQNMSVIVAPSILSADFANLGEDIRRAENAKADWIHVDVMDGQFVPNLTIGPPVVRAIRKQTKLPLDVHLMIVDPDRYLEDFAEAGSDYITVHSEACTHLQRTLSHIRKFDEKAGVALNPATNPDVLKYVLDDLDLVLVMSVNPGFGGQKFINAVVPKIKIVRSMLDNAGHKEVHVSVDGGINATTGRTVIDAGADVLVAGNAVYGAPNIEKAIADLHMRESDGADRQHESKRVVRRKEQPMPSNFGSLGKSNGIIMLAVFAAVAIAQPGLTRDADFIKDTTPIGHTDHGLVSSDQLLELGTQTSSALRLEGEQSMRFNNIDRAIVVLQKSVEMTPSDMDGRILYAEALEKKLNHQKDRDPSLFNFAVKQWLYVAKKLIIWIKRCRA